MSFQGSTEWMEGWRSSGSSDCWRQTVPRPGGSDKKRSVTQWRPSSRWHDERWRTRFSQTLSGLHSSYLLKLVGQVVWCQTMLTLERKDACTGSSSQCRSFNAGLYSVICIPSMTDQTSCCVDGLESVQELCRKVNQQRVTVIKLRDHWPEDWWRATQQHDEATTSGRSAAGTGCRKKLAAVRVREMCRHGRISVQV